VSAFQRMTAVGQRRGSEVVGLSATSHVAVSASPTPLLEPARTSTAARAVRSAGRRAVGFVGVAAVLVFWHVSVEQGLFNRVILPPPMTVAESFVDMIDSGELQRHLTASIRRIVWGFSIAAAVGVSIGALIGMSSIARRTLSPVIELARPISPIAWIPLAILWFGIGDGPAYFVIFLAAFFPIVVNTQKGVSSVALNHRRAAACCGITGLALARKVFLPSAIPDIMAGLRIGLGISWMAVIAAELVSAQSGLGYLIGVSRQLFATEKILVGMITIGVIGFAMSYGMLRLERRLAPWVESTR
jgi:ABC-type nitrate/sulfonate/bicarbonate transport system permease component